MFHFRLQRLLQLREKYEQARARELASAQDVAEQAATIEAKLQKLHMHSREALRNSAGAAGQQVGHLSQLEITLTSLEERLMMAGDAVKEADADVREARELLEGAARDRRVLDRLKSRQADAWRAEEAQRDRIQMDEIALTRFARKNDQQSNGQSTRTKLTPTDEMSAQ